MEINRDKIEFSTGSETKFNIYMGWNGCCQYEDNCIELSIEECKELITELIEHVSGKNETND